MSVFVFPTDYPRIRRVQSFHELVTTPFAQGVNALCWQRILPGDFGEIVAQLGGEDEIATLDEARLRRLELSAATRPAIDVLVEDLRLLQSQGLSPALDCIHRYPRDEDAAPVPTDVYSFHADSAPVEADTYLCTYHGLPSEGLRNDEAERQVDIPGTREELLKRFGGDEGAGFDEYLHEHCYDLHYASMRGARPFSFGVGNLWRIAVDYPGSPVPPCIHRAPTEIAGMSPRLLLIS